MSVQHELAVPKLHGRLYETRRELEATHALAVALAVALDREVDLRQGVTPSTRSGDVVRNTADVLYQARRAGLL
jgi:hypothetical protein